VQATKECEWNGGVAPHVRFLDATERANVLLHSPAAIIPRKKSRVSKLTGMVCRRGDEGASNTKLGNTRQNENNLIFF